MTTWLDHSKAHIEAGDPSGACEALTEDAVLVSPITD